MDRLKKDEFNRDKSLHARKIKINRFLVSVLFLSILLLFIFWVIINAHSAIVFIYFCVYGCDRVLAFFIASLNEINYYENDFELHHGVVL